MKDCKKSAKITLYFTYVLMALLVFFTVILPYGTTWYVELKGRSADLATVVMLTCYPCVPLAAVALISLRQFLKSIINGNIHTLNNLRNLKRIYICCLTAGAIMLIAGHFYMPFYVSSGSAIFCGTVIKAFYDALLSGIYDNDKGEEQ